MSQIAPYHQTNWDWRAAGNFIGGGSGSGLAIAAAVGWQNGLTYWPMALLAMILVGIGLICVWAEIGKPWRALHVYFHPQTSWMTREAFVSLPLFGLGVLAGGASLLGGFPAALLGTLIWLTAAIAACYLFCQARILFASKGIPAWRDELIQPVIIATGLTEGASLLTLFLAFGADKVTVWAILLALLMAARLAAWFRYFVRLRDGRAPKKSVEVLTIASQPILLGGTLAPLLITFLAALFDKAWLLVPAGLLALAAGWYMKYIIIAKAAYNQGFALPNLPVRGRGKVKGDSKPGW